MKYLGIDGCRGGWFLIGLNDDDSSRFCLLKKIVELNTYLDPADVVLIDVPIGLRGRHPDERICDKQARKVLRPKRGSSVFPAPSRCALHCDAYAEASERNKACTHRGLSKQSYGILPKIREVDDYLKNKDRRSKIHEMHPEVCFWALNKRSAMVHKKSISEGYEERLDVLIRYYAQARKTVEMAMQQYRRAEVARDDIVDALVGAVTARNSRPLHRFPEKPEFDAMGLPMEIVY